MRWHGGERNNNEDYIIFFRSNFTLIVMRLAVLQASAGLTSWRQVDTYCHLLVRSIQQTTLTNQSVTLLLLSHNNHRVDYIS
jgi:hypothetical protein